MELRRFSLGTHIIAGTIAFVVFFAAIGLAWAAWPDWSPLERTLSQLGEWNVGRDNGNAPYFFTGGCILAGLLIAFGGIGKYLYEERLNKISGIFFTLAGISLMCVGVISGDFNTAHDTAAIVLFANMGLGTLLTTIADWKDGHKYVPIAGAIILVALLAQWPFLHEGLSECMPIAGLFAWMMVQVYKYHKIGEI